MDPTHKVLLICAGSAFAGALTAAVPACTSLFALSAVVVGRSLASAYSHVASGGLIVYTMGPVREREFIF